MSGLGPAACWLAHKRIESWSRLAKERVGAVRKSTDKSTDEKPSSSPRTSMSIENDSFASSTEVSSTIFKFPFNIFFLFPIDLLLHFFCFWRNHQDFNASTTPPAVQSAPSSSSHTASSEAALHSPLQHQSKSFPQRLQRTPSISSQSSLDSTPTRQSVSCIAPANTKNCKGNSKMV